MISPLSSILDQNLFFMQNLLLKVVILILR